MAFLVLLTADSGSPGADMALNDELLEELSLDIHLVFNSSSFSFSPFFFLFVFPPFLFVFPLSVIPFACFIFTLSLSPVHPSPTWFDRLHLY